LIAPGRVIRTDGLLETLSTQKIIPILIYCCCCYLLGEASNIFCGLHKIKDTQSNTHTKIPDIMRLSAQIIQSAEQRTNPLGEREIILRSLAIPAIEHLAVSRDQFDTMDLSNNHLQRVENFPKMERLATLYLGGNEINFVDGKNLKKNVPNLSTLILTSNGVKGWNVISDLGEGCSKLEFLSLVGNPITSK
jgi:hypothetical protein